MRKAVLKYCRHFGRDFVRDDALLVFGANFSIEDTRRAAHAVRAYGKSTLQTDRLCAGNGRNVSNDRFHSDNAFGSLNFFRRFSSSMSASKSAGRSPILKVFGWSLQAALLVYVLASRSTV